MFKWILFTDEPRKHLEYLQCDCDSNIDSSRILYNKESSCVYVKCLNCGSRYLLNDEIKGEVIN